MNSCCWPLMTATRCSSFPPASTQHFLDWGSFSGGSRAAADSSLLPWKWIIVFYQWMTVRLWCCASSGSAAVLDWCHRSIRCGVVRHRGHFVIAKKRLFHGVKGASRSPEPVEKLPKANLESSVEEVQPRNCSQSHVLVMYCHMYPKGVCVHHLLLPHVAIFKSRGCLSLLRNPSETISISNSC